MKPPWNEGQSAIDLVSFDDKGEFVYDSEARRLLSFSFRYRLGLNIRFIMLIALLVICSSFLQPISVIPVQEFATGDWVYMQSVTLFLFWLVATAYRRNVYSFAAILGIRGASQWPTRGSIGGIFAVEQDTIELRGKLFHTLFEKGWYDLFGFAAALLVPAYLLIGDWVFYSVTYGDWVMAIYSLWRTGIHIPYWVIPLRWIWAMCWGLVMYFTISLLFRLGSLVIQFSRIGANEARLSIVKSLVEESEVAGNAARMRATGSYHKLYRFAEDAFGFFYRFGITIIIVIIGLVGWVLSIAVCSPEIMPRIVDIILFFILVPLMVFAVAFAIILSPMIGLVGILSKVKKLLICRIQDFYEESLIDNLAPNTARHQGGVFSYDLKVLKDALDYVNDLPVWPIGLHEKVTLIGATIGSYLIPLAANWIAG